MKIHLWKSSSCCAADEHEAGCYPRSSFKPKPELPAGTILTVKENGKTSTEYTTAAISQTK